MLAYKLQYNLNKQALNWNEFFLGNTPLFKRNEEDFAKLVFPVLFPLTFKPRAKCPHRFLPSLAKETKRWKVGNFKTEEQNLDSHNFSMVKTGHILRKNGKKMNKTNKKIYT